MVNSFKRAKNYISRHNILDPDLQQEIHILALTCESGDNFSMKCHDLVSSFKNTPIEQPVGLIQHAYSIEKNEQMSVELKQCLYKVLNKNQADILIKAFDENKTAKTIITELNLVTISEVGLSQIKRAALHTLRSNYNLNVLINHTSDDVSDFLEYYRLKQIAKNLNHTITSNRSLLYTRFIE